MEPVGSTAPPPAMKHFDGRCLACGYRLRGLTSWRCPECGRAFDPNAPNTFASPKRRARHVGIELLICASIVAVFLVMIQPFLYTTRPVGSHFSRRAQVGSGSAISLALDLYRAHVGVYPDQLDDLMQKPADESKATRWHGPYINDPNALIDHYGRPLLYITPGTHNSHGYDLWSVGPDGQDGTGDDIGNW